jgi:hypothetical protein
MRTCPLGDVGKNPVWVSNALAICPSLQRSSWAARGVEGAHEGLEVLDRRRLEAHCTVVDWSWSRSPGRQVRVVLPGLDGRVDIERRLLRSRCLGDELL